MRKRVVKLDVKDENKSVMQSVEKSPPGRGKELGIAQEQKGGHCA